MAVDITSAFAWIIDPWMNFACYVPNYKTKANDKMTKWLGLGKRIYWEGKKGNSPGWYQPGGDYTDALASSTLKFEKAD